jgi:hypothetical protein
MDAGGYAAWAAAVTSAATLVVTTVIGGRRAQRQWARQALTDAFVEFLAASWRHSDLAKEPLPPESAPTEAMSAQYNEMRNQLTRLRLLAPPAVVRAGEKLLRLQRAVQESASASEQAGALAAVSAGRHEVVTAAQKAMGLHRPWGTRRAPTALLLPGARSYDTIRSSANDAS